jgi:hypothetical protein
MTAHTTWYNEKKHPIFRQGAFLEDQNGACLPTGSQYGYVPGFAHRLTRGRPVDQGTGNRNGQGNNEGRPETMNREAIHKLVDQLEQQGCNHKPDQPRQ